MKKVFNLLIVSFLAFSFNFNYVKAETYAECRAGCDAAGNNRLEREECYNYCDEKTKSSESKTYKKMQCGEEEIPYIAAQITSKVIFILQIGAVIIIIITGMLDLTKAVMAQKDDDIKKGQQTLIRRIILGAAVFLVFAIVKAGIGIVAPQDQNTSMWKCIDCFVNGDCSSLISN